MTGSGRVVSIVGFQEIIRRTYYRRFVARLPARSLNPRSNRGVGDVPEVPGYQQIDAVRNGNRDASGVIDCLKWNRGIVNRTLRKPFGIGRRLDQCHGFKRA